MNNWLFIEYYFTFSAGALGVVFGGLLYNNLNEIRKNNYKISNDSLQVIQNKLLRGKLFDYINIGGAIGGVIGLSYGYFKKPILLRLIEYYQTN